MNTGVPSQDFQDPISEWLCKSLKIDMDGRPCTPRELDLLWYSLI
jgi:hypothetical protein